MDSQSGLSAVFYCERYRNLIKASLASIYIGISCGLMWVLDSKVNT